jgi:hypothetical protein
MLVLLVSLFGSPIPAEMLSRREGEVEVTGRYREFVDKRIHLHDSAVSFVIEGEALTGLVLGLTAGKDNVLITGRFVDEQTFQVAAIATTARDEERLRDAAAAAAGSCANLLAVGKNALERARRLEDRDLELAAKEVLRHAFLARKKETSAQGPEAHLAWVADMMALIGDKEWALAEGAEILKNNPGFEKAEQYLRSLGCVLWHGGWLSEENFLRAQGFTLIGGAWLSADEANFDRVRDSLAKALKDHAILRTHIDDYYRLSAEQGKLLVGMTREEAVTAAGFPDQVRRIRAGEEVLEQWRFGPRYVYLANDCVALVPDEENG